MRAAEIEHHPSAGFPRFSLVLMVTHACNLRCSYCYGGQRHRGTMSEEVGRLAIDRAIASVARGGTLELGFFGGEPLLQAALLHRLIAHARTRANAAGVQLSAGLTTNGTVAADTAWQILTDPDVSIAISFDGLPMVHDKHRRFPDGHPSSWSVRATMRRIHAAGKDFRVVSVVRPDTVELLPQSLAYLWNLGVREVEPSLDLWTKWSPEDLDRLDAAITKCADIWAGRLPDFKVTWFDEKAIRITNVTCTDTAGCGFGRGEVAVAPSGHLYPCERLIGGDEHENSMRLPGKVEDGGTDFLALPKAACRACEECARCRIAPYCNTTCRCSNYVRSGSIALPDRLLCVLNRACFRETARVLERMHARAVALGAYEEREASHVGSDQSAA